MQYHFNCKTFFSKFDAKSLLSRLDELLNVRIWLEYFYQWLTFYSYLPLLVHVVIEWPLIRVMLHTRKAWVSKGQKNVKRMLWSHREIRPNRMFSQTEGSVGHNKELCWEASTFSFNFVFIFLSSSKNLNVLETLPERDISWTLFF